MTAVVRPVGIYHADLGDSGVALFLVAEIVLTELDIVIVHSKTEFVNECMESKCIEVDEAFKNAVENGATPVLEPELEPWGQRTCYIADPEGNLIEIGSWNKPYEEKDLTEG